MKFEKLNVDTNKRGIWILYGLILGVVLIIIINYFISMAKYKVVDTTKLVSSNINYKLPDLTVLGIYVKEGEEYKYVETIPEGSYTVNTELSLCTKKGGEEIKDIIEYREDGLYIGINERGTRCKVYLDEKVTAKDTLDRLKLKLSQNGCPIIDENTGLPTNGLTSDNSTNGYLCEGVDDDGKTYYFRGAKASVNNWVQMGTTYWRIIRINGDGSIRLIYNGTSVEDTGIAKTNVAYNTTVNDNKYVGFMYGDTSGDYAAATTNTNISNILTELNTWYESSDFPAEYKGLLDENAGFCNDRTPYNGNNTSSQIIDTSKYGFSTNTTTYGAKIRIEINKKPTFKCSQKNDLFTKEESEKGNRKLKNPIGLITADEVMFAGSGPNSDYKNTTYYLYNGQSYWTMSPFHFTKSNYANVFYVDDAYGYLSNNTISNTTYGIRPVINLKAKTPFTSDGNGSSSNPFVVKLN